MRRPHVRWAKRLALRGCRGFTLVEIMVALGIVAVALSTGFQAVGGLSNQAQRQSDALLGQLCADNLLTQMRLQKSLPGTGEHTQDCAQGGRVYQLSLTVQPTPNPHFVRADVAARRDGSKAYRVIALLRSSP